ncbi:PLAT/LH2 domain-containing protein [Streptomyces nigra]
MPEYRIQVVTGKVESAGTDANVYLTIYGSAGSSEEIHLESGGDDFERASVSNFVHTLRDLGDLRKVRIRHDNTGGWPGWFLERIVIRKRGQRPGMVVPLLVVALHRRARRTDRPDPRPGLTLSRQPEESERDNAPSLMAHNVRADQRGAADLRLHGRLRNRPG